MNHESTTEKTSNEISSVSASKSTEQATPSQIVIPPKVGITLCTCDACNYTFNPAIYHSKHPIPKRCPDCGKMKVDGKPAVRLATDEEVGSYWRIHAEMIEELERVP